MIPRKATTAAAFLISLSTYLLFPADSLSEFYRYTTEDGDVHYVDDIANVPEKYQPEMKVYREKYDHLPEGERAIMLQKDGERDAHVVDGQLGGAARRTGEGVDAETVEAELLREAGEIGADVASCLLTRRQRQRPEHARLFGMAEGPVEEARRR